MAAQNVPNTANKASQVVGGTQARPTLPPRSWQANPEGQSRFVAQPWLQVPAGGRHLPGWEEPSGPEAHWLSPEHGAHTGSPLLPALSHWWLWQVKPAPHCASFVHA